MMVSELRVLVVDDDEMLCRAVSRMLRPFAVTLASGGAEALRRLHEDSYDVILCDVMMPEMSGPELYKKLDPAIQDRVLFMSGGMLERIRPMTDELPNRLIEKPFSRSDLKHAVSDLAASLAPSS